MVVWLEQIFLFGGAELETSIFFKNFWFEDLKTLLGFFTKNPATKNIPDSTSYNPILSISEYIHRFLFIFQTTNMSDIFFPKYKYLTTKNIYLPVHTIITHPPPPPRISHLPLPPIPPSSPLPPPTSYANPTPSQFPTAITLSPESAPLPETLASAFRGGGCAERKGIFLRPRARSRGRERRGRGWSKYKITRDET